MKALLFALLVITFPLSCMAAFSLQQSSPDTDWLTRESDRVKLIYPEELESESLYITNLVNYYGAEVGQTYGIREPLKFPLIIRPEMAEPNGFVTLAPRRSEWFASAIYFPYVGATDWYQTLSIHEYRHIVQYENFNQGTSKILDYLLGDSGRFIAMFLGLQSWYFEGDAVWAETKYTDAGRGRSPRFMARLKALVLSNQIPTYDEFLNGTYNNKLPNHYVWGYVLITSAVNKYGEDFWKKVTRKVARFPNPWRLVNAIESVSHQDFRDFYDQTMGELRERWSKDLGETEIGEYREQTFPFRLKDSTYYVRYDLDSYYSVVKMVNGNEVKVADIPFINEVSLIHMSKNKAVYPQLLPHKRYGFKESSDLIVLDLENGEKKQITNGERLYNPHLNKEANKILAVEFRPDQKWHLVELNLSGKKLRSIHIEGMKPTEAFYLSNEVAVAFILNKSGYKSLVKINLATKQYTTILKPSRNLLNALNVDKSGNVFFEAQYKGKNEIFQLTSTQEFKKCTETKIAAFTPSSNGSELFFSESDVNGTTIQTRPLSQCKTIPSSELIDYNYLSSDSPSDNYTKFAVNKIPNQDSFYTANEEKHPKEEYGDLDSRMLVPHSWSFLAGRGFGIAADTDNYLGSIGVYGAYGLEAEEHGNYLLAGVDYKKYYPVFRFMAETRERFVKYYKSENDLDWKEKAAGAEVLLPYLKRKDLYTFTANLSGSWNYLSTEDYRFNDNGINLRDQNYHLTSVHFDTKLSKDLVYRSIVSPVEVSYMVDASKANNVSNNDWSSYRIYQEAGLQFPGFFKHNAFILRGSQEKQGERGYRFLPYATNPVGYVFSRGYAYKSVSEYRKASANYVFPIAYPDLNIRSVYYLRRLYMNAFFDSTSVTNLGANPTLNSYGLELNLESKIFRILPITIGLRGVHTDQDNLTNGEVFLNLGVAI